MADMFDYLKGRGNILFSQEPPNPVDALIFSTLAYISYDGIVPEEVHRWVYLENVAKVLFESSDVNIKSHGKNRELLKAASLTRRFKKIKMCYYQNMFIPEEETQFAAVTFFLEDGSAFLSFRGTDSTLTGWKEDFNMSFQDSVPAQRMAHQYVQEFCESSSALMRLGGHSKGGNLAVYAAAKCGAALQQWILEVYNQDGPGFTNNLMGDSGYQSMVPKIHTYVPQSSIIGMLLEHEEPYIVVKSKQIGLMQHDPYSWEVKGSDFVLMKEITRDSRFVDKTLKTWLADMSVKERNELIDTIFELLAAGDAVHTNEIMRPENVIAYLKTLSSDNEMWRLLAGEIVNLIRAAAEAFF